jgi:hypothetical protein
LVPPNEEHHQDNRNDPQKPEEDAAPACVTLCQLDEAEHDYAHAHSYEEWGKLGVVLPAAPHELAAFSTHAMSMHA